MQPLSLKYGLVSGDRAIPDHVENVVSTLKVFPSMFAQTTGKLHADKTMKTQMSSLEELSKKPRLLYFSWAICYCCLLQTQCGQATELIPLTMCVLMERDTEGLIYDYRKSEAAVNMAVETANENILAPNFRIDVIYRDTGNNCPDPGLTSGAAHVLSLRDTGINCNLYIGLGKLPI